MFLRKAEDRRLIPAHNQLPAVVLMSTVYSPVLRHWRPLRESNPPYQDENLAS